MRVLILLIAAGLIGFMIFGKNPVREFQNKQKVMIEKYGSDELTARTNMYLEKQQQNSQVDALTPGNIISLKTAGEGSKIVSNEKEISDSLRRSARIVGNDPQYRVRGTYVAPLGKEDGQGFGDIVIKDNTAVNRGASDSKGLSEYYPPIARPEPAAEEKPTGREPRLRSGQPIVYDNIGVYSLDADGRRTLLPDGNYVLENGTGFEIRGGRRISR